MIFSSDGVVDTGPRQIDASLLDGDDLPIGVQSHAFLRELIDYRQNA